MRLFHQRCKENGIMHNNEQIFDFLNEFEEKDAYKQLSLLDYKI